MQSLELQPAEARSFEKVVAAAAATWGEEAVLQALRAPPAEQELEPEPEPEPEPEQAAPADDAAADEEVVADDWDATSDEEQASDAADDWDASSASEDEERPAKESDAPAALPVDPALAAAASDSAEAFVKQQRRPKFVSMLEHRRTLPAFAAAPELGRLLDAHDVLLVSGATGCGKSTQLPQLILDRALRASPPPHCSVLVTQPRRLAAIGLAERVAAERDEECGRGSVGFAIRGESRRCASTRILYCTVGVLLKQLEAQEAEDGPPSNGAQSFAAVTHIVVDEVHERSVDVDLLLLYLRRAHLQHAQGSRARGAPPPKLVLMSATTETERLAAYFGAATAPVGRLNIEGRTFPVERRYLEDAVVRSGYLLRSDQIGGQRRNAPRRGQQQTYARQRSLEDSIAVEGGDRSVAEIEVGAAASDWMRNLGERGMLQLLNDAAAAAGAADGDSADSTGQEYTHTPTTVETLRSMDLAVVNVDLVVALAAKLVEEITGASASTNADDAASSQDVRRSVETGGSSSQNGGAVLIFLPGIKEIEDSLAAMSNHSLLGDSTACALFKLHSSVSMEEQVRKRISFAPYHSKHECFAKTYLGQTLGNHL